LRESVGAFATSSAAGMLRPSKRLAQLGHVYKKTMLGHRLLLDPRLGLSGRLAEEGVKNKTLLKIK
jgi:hypothetical protein